MTVFNPPVDLDRMRQGRRRGRRFGRVILLALLALIGLPMLWQVVR